MKDDNITISLKYGVAISGVQNQGPGEGSIWAGWAKRRGKIADGSDPNGGVGFFEKYEEDIKLAADMGLKAFRFSIDWARVEPKRGEIDEDYLLWCGNVINEIKERGMEVVVTLFHFDYPQWFEDLGGFLNKRNSSLFVNYVEVVVNRFRGLVDVWITLNEPVNWIFHVHIYGDFPPGNKSFIKALKLFNVFVEIHNQCYKLIKKIDKKIPIGVSNSTCWFLPFKVNSLLESNMAVFLNWLSNWRFIEKTMDCCDFIGLQYYTRVKLRLLRNGNIFGVFQEYGVTQSSGDMQRTDVGWDIVPEGLDYFIRQIWIRYHKPIYVTEVGLAEDGVFAGEGKYVDSKRQEYIKQVDRIVRNAAGDGVNIIGVLWWTLTDNWEWTLGFPPKFGFYKIAPDGTRIPRESVSLMRNVTEKA